MDVTNYPQEFNTERLFIRRLYLDDFLVWERFLADERATAYFPEEMRQNPREGALKWIEKQICRYRDHQGGLMALINRTTNEFVGQCGLNVQEVDAQQELEVGYHLLPEFWGYGYATEAAVAMKHLGFALTTVPRIISIIHKENIPSQAVARRNGMEVIKQTTWKTLPVAIFGQFR